MKKLMMFAVGLGLLLGSVSFAQNDKKMADKKTGKNDKKTKQAKKADPVPNDKKM